MTACSQRTHKHTQVHAHRHKVISSFSPLGSAAAVVVHFGCFTWSVNGTYFPERTSTWLPCHSISLWRLNVNTSTWSAVCLCKIEPWIGMDFEEEIICLLWQTKRRFDSSRGHFKEVQVCSKRDTCCSALWVEWLRAANLHLSKWLYDCGCDEQRCILCVLPEDEAAPAFSRSPRNNSEHLYYFYWPLCRSHSNPAELTERRESRLPT